jgi:hypothetical protein
MGMVTDITHFHKFGTNLAVGVTEETLWSPGGNYTWLDVGTALEMTCTDNVNGVGQTLLVEGLDENFAQQTTTVVLAGQTPVPLDGLWTVVHRVTQISAAPDPVGDVYIATQAATYVAGVPQELNLIQVKVDYTNASQQSENAFVVVPAGHVGLVYDFEAGLQQATGTPRFVEVALEIQELAAGSTTTWAPRRRVDSVECSTNNPQHAEDLQFPLVFPQCTRIEMRGVASVESRVRGDFTVLFVPDGSD